VTVLVVEVAASLWAGAVTGERWSGRFALCVQPVNELDGDGRVVAAVIARDVVVTQYTVPGPRLFPD
jgi:hypothetical protein